MENRVIHGTEFWTSSNIADGLNALATCIEARCHFFSYSGLLTNRMQMVLFAVFMMWSFNWKEYQVQPHEPHTSIWRPLWDSINLCTPLLSIFGPIRILLTHAFGSWRPVGDFAVEIGSQFSYFASRITGREYQQAPTKQTFGQAFGVESYAQEEEEVTSDVSATPYGRRTSYDEETRFTPYTASVLDLSRVRLPEEVVGYNPKEPMLAA